MLELYTTQLDLSTQVPRSSTTKALRWCLAHTPLEAERRLGSTATRIEEPVVIYKTQQPFYRKHTCTPNAQGNPQWDGLKGYAFQATLGNMLYTAVTTALDMEDAEQKLLRKLHKEKYYYGFVEHTAYGEELNFQQAIMFLDTYVFEISWDDFSNWR